MTKKGRDPRQDPDDTASGGVPRRVDRVFVPSRPTTIPPPATPIPERRAPSRDLGDAEIVLRREIARLQHALAKKDDELAVQIEERLVVAGKAAKQEAQLEQIAAEVHRREVERDAGRDAELVELRAQLAAQALATHQLTERYESVIDEFTELTQDRDARVRELATARAAVTELATECAQWPPKHARVTSALDEQTALAATLTTERDQLAAELTDLRPQVAAMIAEADARDVEVAARAELQAELATVRNELATVIGERDERIAELASSLSSRSAAEVTRMLTRDADHAAELDTVRTACGAELASLTSARDELMTALTRTTTERDERVAELVDTRTKLMAEVARAAAERDERGKRLEDVERARGDEVALLAATVAELAQVRATLSTAQDAGMAVAARATLLEDELVASTATLATATTELVALRARLDASQQEGQRAVLDRAALVTYLEEGLRRMREPTDS
ncbi:MAG: hypothetical protein NT062_20805 [Proteobacteria bacterium]|nr:hypothetical protein [Pseudomonadota bacterium]